MIHEEPDKAKGLIGYLLPEHEKSALRAKR